MNIAKCLRTPILKNICERLLVKISTSVTNLLISVQKFIEIQGWLLLTFFICLFNHLSSFTSIIIEMSEKRNASNDSKNEWLLLSVTFLAKLELVFVLKFENTFS